MKRYLIVVSLLTLLLATCYYFVYFDGSLYVPDFRHSRDIQTNFRQKDQSLVQEDDSPFIVKGVDIESSVAGYHHNEFAIGYQKYRDWFKKISDMGANTIRVKTVMNVAFYDALADHNEQVKQPLYLLQGIRVDDYRNNSSIHALDERYQGRLIRDAKAAVDVIHGRKQVWNTDFGSQHYHKDLSKWVLGYIVGDHWNSGTVAFSNHQALLERVEGEYFQSSPEATTFEKMLIQVMDDLVRYETKKYGWQHLISFENSPTTDPFAYRKPFAAQAPKYVQLDMEHVKKTKKVKAGLFAAYQLFDFHPKYKDYLRWDQYPQLSELRQDIENTSFAQGYTKLLTSYHQLPVMITGYGYSTSRGIDRPELDQDSLPMSEIRQGERLVEDFTSFIEANSVGATINAWQDDWNARSWNTSFATNRHHTFRWGDVQVSNQGFGLMTFENEKAKTIDGKKEEEEWQKDPLLERDGDRLWVDSDEKYLYFAIERASASHQKWMLPIDTIEKLGATQSAQFPLQFEKPADFLVLIDETAQSRILVQERYQAARANYLMQLSGDDPFIHPPAKDSQQFVPIEMVMKNNLIFEDIETAPREDKWLPTYETGVLRHGNASRTSPVFDSRVDLSFSEHFIEGRIPWQLLNMSNPAENKIHDDYYEKYGVEEYAISSIAVGFGKVESKDMLAMKSVALPTWERPKVKEVLKASYALLKAAWTEKEH